MSNPIEDCYGRTVKSIVELLQLAGVSEDVIATALPTLESFHENFAIYNKNVEALIKACAHLGWEGEVRRVGECGTTTSYEVSDVVYTSIKKSLQRLEGQAIDKGIHECGRCECWSDFSMYDGTLRCDECIEGDK